MQSVRDKMGITVSLWRTFVFALLCGFFTIVAAAFEWKYRIRFRINCRYKKFSTEKLNAILSDFDKLLTCEDPYIENFLTKHPELSGYNTMWLFTLSWKKKFKKELAKRGEQIA